MEEEILKAPTLSKDVIMRRMHRVRASSCLRPRAYKVRCATRSFGTAPRLMASYTPPKSTIPAPVPNTFRTKVRY